MEGHWCMFQAAHGQYREQHVDATTHETVHDAPRRCCCPEPQTLGGAGPAALCFQCTCPGAFALAPNPQGPDVGIAIMPSCSACAVSAAACA